MLNAGKHLAHLVGLTKVTKPREMLPGVQHDILLSIFQRKKLNTKRKPSNTG
jgi:hypothetical protein